MNPQAQKNYTGTGASATCQRCAVVFHRPLSKARKHHCTAACRKEAEKAARTKPCEGCGEDFLAHGGRVDTQRFCSIPCRSVGMSSEIRSSAPPPSVPGAVWIPLTGGKFALVDEADAELVSKHIWHYKSNGYAATVIGGKSTRIHQLLVGSWNDHKNLDPLDNRRQNLRPASFTQNIINRGRQRNNTSGFKGVTRYGKKWGARVGVGKGRVWLGQFDTPEEAAAAYDLAVVKAHGEFARPNSMESESR